MLPIPFLKKGKTGILDKGSQQDRNFFFFFCIFGTNREHSKKGQDGIFKKQRSGLGEVSEYVK